MSFFNWFTNEPPEVATEAQSFVIGEGVTDLRIASRLERLYTWFEQKPDAPSEKRLEMRKSIRKHQHILAGRGHPFCKTKDEVSSVIATIRAGN